ncbi:unnamed protein product [Dicrocoelium dendriticum]|nr:unnamed protein product [Dicrocoelium dendriticum]
MVYDASLCQIQTPRRQNRLKGLGSCFPPKLKVTVPIPHHNLVQLEQRRNASMLADCEYILSSGKDSAVKLWELATGRCLITYTGAGTVGHQTHRSMAVFNHTEDYVLFPDEATKSLCCWDSRNADRQRLLALNHNGPIRCFVHSPTTAAFMSCSDDNRARFWYKRPISD